LKTISLNLSKDAIQKFRSQNVMLRDTNVPNLFFRYSLAEKQLGSFHCRFSVDGISTSKVVGKFPLLSIKEARTAAIEKRHSNEAKKYPATKARYFKNSGELLMWYLEFRLSDPVITTNTKKNVVHQVTKLLLPKFTELPIAQISAGYLAESWIIPSQTKYGLSTLKGAFQCLKAAFGQAQRLGYLSDNPVKDIAFSDITAGKVIPRKSKVERWPLKQVLKLIERFPQDTKIFSMLCLGYLTRNGETALATWNDFDFDKMLWHIPGHNTKTGQGLTHPITPKMRSVLLQYRAWQRKRIRSKFLFPRTNGYGSITPSQAAHSVSRHSHSKLRLHDLRKYGSSYLRDMGVDYYIVERILNHKMTTLDQTYIHTSVFGIVRNELEKWHYELQIV
jgi:integrase